VLLQHPEALSLALQRPLARYVGMYKRLALSIVGRKVPFRLNAYVIYACCREQVDQCLRD
jgi:hypothetical protein